MKALIVLLGIGMVAGGPTFVEMMLGKMTPEETVQFIAGFLDGMSIDLGVKDVDTCVSDTDKVAEHVETAFADFEKETYESILEGIKELATALEDLPDDLRQCEKASEEDIKALEKALKIFKNPITLVYVVGKTLVLDGKEILKEIEEARVDYANKDYFNCGKEIGLAFFEFVKNE